MRRPLAYLAAGALVLHGVVHLIGTGVYLELVQLSGFQYKTTLLGSRVAIGDTGMRVFGALWGVAAIGFWTGAQAYLLEWTHWRRLVGAVTVFSLVLTTFDFGVAFGGIAMNLAILAALLTRPEF